MRRREKVGLPVPRRMVDIPVVRKNFKILKLKMQMKKTITLRVYLFIRQLLQNLSIALTIFLKKSYKAPKKLLLALTLKLNF